MALYVCYQFTDLRGNGNWYVVVATITSLAASLCNTGKWKFARSKRNSYMQFVSAEGSACECIIFWGSWCHSGWAFVCWWSGQSNSEGNFSRKMPESPNYWCGAGLFSAGTISFDLLAFISYWSSDRVSNFCYVIFPSRSLGNRACCIMQQQFFRFSPCDLVKQGNVFIYLCCQKISQMSIIVFIECRVFFCIWCNPCLNSAWVIKGKWVPHTIIILAYGHLLQVWIVSLNMKVFILCRVVVCQLHIMLGFLWMIWCK